MNPDHDQEPAALTLGALWRTARSAGRHVTDVILPPECLKCRAPVADPGNLCADCFYSLSFITEPVCVSCGVPFETAAEAGSACGACTAKPPVYGAARAVFVYDENSRALVLRLKHADRTELAPFLAGWMVRAGAALLAEADMLCAVPLARRRLFDRQFNQAALLALQVSQRAAVPFVPGALIRTRDTGSQGGRSRLGRRHNVKGAFKLRSGVDVAGKRVVLVDDVMTTGATVEGCAKALLKGGAVRVDVLTVARVPLAG